MQPLVMLRLMMAVAFSAVSFYATTVFAVWEASVHQLAFALGFNVITTRNQAIGVWLIAACPAAVGGQLHTTGQRSWVWRTRWCSQVSSPLLPACSTGFGVK